MPETGRKVNTIMDKQTSVNNPAETANTTSTNVEQSSEDTQAQQSDLESQLRHWKAMSRKNEDRAKANAEKARKFDELEPAEQRVLGRIAAGTLIGNDADEEAALHASLGDRIADRVAAVGGSWGFIIAFGVVLVSWMLLNSGVLGAFGLAPFDSYPFIFLNLMLSMLAPVQTPVNQPNPSVSLLMDAPPDAGISMVYIPSPWCVQS